MAEKHSNPTEIRLAAPLEFAAGDGDALPAKFTGIAYSGGKAESYGCVIDMESTTFAQKMPLLFEHMRSSIVGVVDQASSKGFKLTVAGKLFSDMVGSDAERIAQLSKRGAPYQMSVGLFGYREEFVPAGQTIKVNGQDFAGPIYVLRGGVVREVSIVTLGADAKTGAQFFSHPDTANSGNSKESTVTPEQIKALEDSNKALQASLDETKRLLGEQKTAADLAAANAAAAAKTARTAAVTALFAESSDKPSEAQLAAYVGLSDAQFAVAAEDRRALVAKLKKRDPMLFADIATGEGQTQQQQEQDPPKPKAVNFSDVYEKRRKAAAEFRA